MHSEAPASVSYTLKSPEGYPLIFTARYETVGDLVNELEGIEQSFKDMGYTPDLKQRGGFAKKPVVKTGEACPKCKGDLIEASKKDGTKFKKCENNIWDFNLKKNTGSCDFIDWGESSAPTSEMKMTGASEAQKSLITSKWPSMWEEGMSKAQASDVISSQMGK